MPINITKAPKDTTERNQSIDKILPDLDKLIKPDEMYSQMVIDELVDVLELDPQTIPTKMSLLEYNSYQNRAVVVDLRNEIASKIHYQLLAEKFDTEGKTKEEIELMIEADLKRQIVERELEADRLIKELREKEKLSEWLEGIKTSSPNETVVLELSADTERAVISSLVKAVEERLKQDVSDEERIFLAFLNGKFDSAKTAIDAYNPQKDPVPIFKGMKLHIKRSEVAYLASLDHKELDSKIYEKAQILISYIEKMEASIVSCKTQAEENGQEKLQIALERALESLQDRKDSIYDVANKSKANGPFDLNKFEAELANEARLTLKIGDDLKKDLPSSIVSAFRRFAASIAKVFNVQVSPTLSKDNLRPALALGKRISERIPLRRGDGSLDESLSKIQKRVSPPDRRDPPKNKP